MTSEIAEMPTILFSLSMLWNTDLDTLEAEKVWKNNNQQHLIGKGGHAHGKE